MSGYFEPGARWQRCDLHVHTPWDVARTFGENVKHAIEAFRKEEPQKLAEIAGRFIDACRAGAEGNGLDVVALTDHNSIDGYRWLKPYIDAVSQKEQADGAKVPIVLPGVEFSVGGERPLHFLVVFAASTTADEIDSAIRHVFGPRDTFDSKTGTPQATGTSVDEFPRKLYEYCRPTTGERNLQFVLIPAHADSAAGVATETSGSSGLTVATTLWDEMKGRLRQWVITRQDWNGFQTARRYEDLPPAFRDLLAQWMAARRGLDWDALEQRDRTRIRESTHWPLIECSDPHRYEDVGTRYCWLKMEESDVEGIRLALLDPESRLRRMADGRPGHAYPFIRHVRIRKTDFFEDVEIPINPCLNTLIGGRGSGKSTILECIRYALDRARPEDFDQDESEVYREVRSLLSEKAARDFGETRGILLPGYEITVEFEVAGRMYVVTRSNTGVTITRQGEEQQTAPLDIRALIAPRVLSQRQIARIARDPGAQRRELDALIEPEAIREFENERRDTLIEMEALQTKRRNLKSRVDTLGARETELAAIRDQIEFLERGGNQEILARFAAVQAEDRWLEQVISALESGADRLEAHVAELLEERERLTAPEHPSAEWLVTVGNRVEELRTTTQEALKARGIAMRELAKTIRAEKGDSVVTAV